MKKLFFALLLNFSTATFGQTPKISINEIQNYIGKTITVCEMVKGTFKTNEHKYSLLNLGDAYPDQKLTVFIKKKYLKNFSYEPVEYLNGKTICVSGTVFIFKGKPQIKIKRQIDIEVQ